MIRTFGDRETEKVYKGQRSTVLPTDLQNIARRKLRMIDAAVCIEDLRIPPHNHLEKLIGNLKGYHSIRINDQWRIVFKYMNGGAEEVEIKDYH